MIASNHRLWPFQTNRNIMKLNPVGIKSIHVFIVPIGVEDTNLSDVPNFTEMGLVAQDLENVEELFLP